MVRNVLRYLLKILLFYLYRNGLRPSRFYVLKDNIMVMASEVGVYDTDPSNVLLKSRLKPGRMLLVDTKQKTIIQDVELKRQIAISRPHSDWLKEEVKFLFYPCLSPFYPRIN